VGEATKACPTCAVQLDAAAAVCRFCQHDFKTGAAGLVPPPPRRSAGASAAVTVVAFVVFALLVLGIGLAIVIPGMVVGGRASSERNASASLKTLRAAQEDFRSNDRDNDGVGNYWVRDVYGLYALCPSTNQKSIGTPSVREMIKLVEPSLAAADGGGLGVGPGCVPVADAVGMMSTKASYVYIAFESYESSSGKVERYAEEGAIPAMGRCFNAGKYGYFTAPVKLSGGKMFFIVTEDITIWRQSVPSGYQGTYTPGRLVMSGAPFGPGTAVPLAPGAGGWAKLD
jgi:type II secretory pathway pseudopilin PulG